MGLVGEAGRVGDPGQIPVRPLDLPGGPPEALPPAVGRHRDPVMAAEGAGLDRALMRAPLSMESQPRIPRRLASSASDFFVLVVIAERERILALGAFEGNATDFRKGGHK